MTAVLPGFVAAETDSELSQWTSPVLAPLSIRIRRRLQIGELSVLTVVALLGYLGVAVWLRDDLHLFVNDALARTSDAVFVTVGRDPHLGAIGFFWPPLPQLIQCPFVPFLEPFGRSDLAGPISSAVCTALTIPVLGRLCHRLGLSRPLRFAICAAYALNPVTVYYAGIGMSEACSVLFIAVAMLGFLTFIQTRSTPDLIVLTVGLSGAVLTRLEAPLLVVVLTIMAAFEWRHWRRSLWTAILIALPPAACFLCWMLVQWILVKSPLFFLHQGGSAPVRASWLPNTVAHPVLAFPWALHWALVLGPLLAVTLAFLLWHPQSAKRRGTIGILGAASVFLAIQIDQVISHTGFGDPRYFVTCIIFATIGAIWLSSIEPRALSRCWNFSLVGVLVLGGLTGSRALSNGRVTHVEGECAFFDYGVGKILPFVATSYPSNSLDYCPHPINQLAAWQSLDSRLNTLLKPSDRVLADNYSDFSADLFTRHPGQFIVRNDRDWQKIIANPAGTVTYIVTANNAGAGLAELPGGDKDAGLAIVRGDPAAWKLIYTSGHAADFALGSDATVALYKYVGAGLPNS